MSLWKIAWRSMQQRALASWLTGLSMALGVALVVTVLVIHSVVDGFFRNSSQGYDMIVGATKGGRLQLVLNTVYHLSTPVENLPYSFYKEFLRDRDHKGRYADLIDVAVPLCLGDSYGDFRVVGTTPAMFEVWEPYQKYEFAEGRNFKPENFFEGVIGATVARQTGLKIGSQFNPSHGVEAGGHKHDAFTVVGILQPTGTPNDRALFVNMEGFYLLRGHAKEPPEPEQGHGEAAHPEHEEHAEAEKHHDKHAGAPEAEADHDEHTQDEHAQEEHAAGEHARGEHDEHDEHKASAHEEHAKSEHDEHQHGEHAHQPLPESQREVTAILVRSNSKNLMASMSLRRAINKGVEAQAVLPAAEIATLLDLVVGNTRLLLLVLSVLIVVVAGIGLMVSIYNSMSDRRRDIAVMRSLGARRHTVLSIILLEAMMLSVGGGLAGWVLGHLLVAAASPWVVAQTGFAIGFLHFTWQEAALLPALIVLASLVGYLPGMAAYQTDVAKALSSAP